MMDIGQQQGPRGSSAETYTRSGNQWTGEIIVTLWDQWHKVWTMRNSVIHGHDQATRAQHQREVDMRRLQSVYQSRHLMEPSVEEILFSTIDEHQRLRGPTAIHNWLSIHETTFIQSVKNVSKRAIQGVRSIKTYFAPRSSLDTPTGDHHKPTDTTTTQHQKNIKRPLTIKSYFATGRPPESTRHHNSKCQSDTTKTDSP